MRIFEVGVYALKGCLSAGDQVSEQSETPKGHLWTGTS